MTHPALETRLCSLVGIKYPIVQTGMGWVAGPRLVAATANAGGLGILASATMTLPELASAMAEVRARTTAPFGVNLRTDAADVTDRIALMIETGARVASFAQAPNPALVARCKEMLCDWKWSLIRLRVNVTLEIVAPEGTTDRSNLSAPRRRPL